MAGKDILSGHSLNYLSANVTYVQYNKGLRDMLIVFTFKSIRTEKRLGAELGVFSVPGLTLVW